MIFGNCSLLKIFGRVIAVHAALSMKFNGKILVATSVCNTRRKFDFNFLTPIGPPQNFSSFLLGLFFCPLEPSPQIPFDPVNIPVAQPYIERCHVAKIYRHKTNAKRKPKNAEPDGWKLCRDVVTVSDCCQRNHGKIKRLQKRPSLQKPNDYCAAQNQPNKRKDHRHPPPQFIFSEVIFSPIQRSKETIDGPRYKTHVDTSGKYDFVTVLAIAKTFSTESVFIRLTGRRN
mmetsp:Transcript_18981/g.44066  ORF Transcript_18981/g.44066 Transcript_18981/m.44066 type:complete len:230 (+) Transcript_18981:1026-1715(+)